MYMDASIFVVGVPALKARSEFQTSNPLPKRRLTAVIMFFLSANIAKFDLPVDSTLASKRKRRNRYKIVHVDHLLLEFDGPLCCDTVCMSHLSENLDKFERIPTYKMIDIQRQGHRGQGYAWLLVYLALWNSEATSRLVNVLYHHKRLS